MRERFTAEEMEGILVLLRGEHDAWFGAAAKRAILRSDAEVKLLEQAAETERRLAALEAEHARLARQVNGLVEIGQEVHRILWHMTKAQRLDLLPDWFQSRLRELVPMPDDLMLTPEERAALAAPKVDV